LPSYFTVFHMEHRFMRVGGVKLLTFPEIMEIYKVPCHGYEKTSKVKNRKENSFRILYRRGW